MDLHVKMPYGSTSWPLHIEADLLEPTVRTARSAEPANEHDELRIVREALAAPIGSRRLREIVQPGESVAIIVNDITRLTRTDLMLEPLFEELAQAGVADDDVFIMFALAAAGGAILFFVADKSPASAPKAVQGRIDLSSWDFSRSGPLSLSGTWSFEPGSFSQGTGAALSGHAQVPTDWRSASNLASSSAMLIVSPASRRRPIDNRRNSPTSCLSAD